MVQKKVCMLGTFAVGKTSLVRRFVDSIFADTYLTTIGVKIDKKVVQVDGQPLTCVLWDLAGEDGPQDIRKSYLAGAAGFLLVADGTRRDTLTSALAIHEAVKRVSPPAVSVMALNKSDLAGEWDIGPNDESELSRSGWSVIRTSAKTGAGVEDAFQVLARAMLNGRR